MSFLRFSPRKSRSALRPPGPDGGFLPAFGRKLKPWKATPGHLMQRYGPVPGYPSASGYAPGQLKKLYGSVPGYPVASGWAPGHRGMVTAGVLSRRRTRVRRSTRAALATRSASSPRRARSAKPHRACLSRVLSTLLVAPDERHLDRASEALRDEHDPAPGGVGVLPLDRDAGLGQGLIAFVGLVALDDVDPDDTAQRLDRP